MIPHISVIEWSDALISDGIAALRIIDGLPQAAANALITSCSDLPCRGDTSAAVHTARYFGMSIGDAFDIFTAYFNSDEDEDEELLDDLKTAMRVVGTEMHAWKGSEGLDACRGIAHLEKFYGVNIVDSDARANGDADVGTAQTTPEEEASAVGETSTLAHAARDFLSFIAPR